MSRRTGCLARGRRRILAGLEGCDPHPGFPAAALGVLSVTRLGSTVRCGAGRPEDPDLDRVVGAAVAIGALVFVFEPLLGLVVGGGIALWGGWRERRRKAAEVARLVEELPDVVDLLALAAASGATPRHAVEAVARHGTGSLAAALADALVATDQAGTRLADALTAVADRLGDEVGSVLRPLVAAERYGTPLGPTLALVGRDLRDVRRRRSETEIRKVPVRLVFPLVCCTLPAFALLTVVPLLASSLRQFTLP